MFQKITPALLRLFMIWHKYLLYYDFLFYLKIIKMNKVAWVNSDQFIPRVKIRTEIVRLSNREWIFFSGFARILF